MKNSYKSSFRIEVTKKMSTSRKDVEKYWVYFWGKVKGKRKVLLNGMDFGKTGLI
jgi:hypothetical protein